MQHIQGISLSALTSLIQETITFAFIDRYFWVMADVTDHNHYVLKGNHYFNLVEKESSTNLIVSKLFNNLKYLF